MSLFHKLTTIMLAAVIALSANAAPGDDVRTPDNRVVYEVFVRNFSSSSRLSAVTQQVPRLKQLGVDVIWLMPIYKGGDKDRWGTYSSPYAVKDYTQVDPLYGTVADLKTLVTTAHEQGMEVWLDWVANHTSTDAVWTTSHPEYYGSKFSKPNGWSDVYQLDFTNSAMRQAMIDAMKYWVTECDIDGFRCDYADGVPFDFWKQARSEIDKVKHLTWLAESAGEGDKVKLLDNGFDYNYAWGFNTSLIKCGSSSTCANDAAKAIYLLYNSRDKSSYTGKSRLVYLSNHDVVQDNNGTPDRHFGSNLKAMTVLSFTAFGMPLIYNGQEINWSTGQVLLAEKSPINWNSGDKTITELITSLTDLKHRYTALNAGDTGGECIRHSTGNKSSQVLVYERRLDKQSIVVMLNFGSTATVEVNTLPFASYKEWFTGETSDFRENRTFTIPAKGYQVWVKTDDTRIKSHPHKIYVEDNTGWGTLNIYGWADGNYAEIFGGWPGMTNDATEVLSDGKTYKVWTIPENLSGHPYHLIFNRSSSQLPDFDFSIDRNIALTVTASGIKEKDVPGINDIDSAIDIFAPDYDGPATFYNLQGIKTDNPIPGQVYIVRQGKTAKKVLFR